MIAAVPSGRHPIRGSALTQLLYYEDSSLREFEGTVQEVADRDGAIWVELDRTAFYPGGGGQPPDRGRLGDVPVTDVREEEGRLWHRIEGKLEARIPIRGALDWRRRFDHMQQHTGQHILSQAFIEVASAETRSFHLGEEEVSIDVAHPGPDPELLRRAEERANEIVWEDRPVRIHEVSRAEVGRFPLRKLPAVEGMVRVVEVEGFDWAACGGTHVSRSGQVGIITLLSTEKYKGGTRVAFVCGGRALRRQRERARLLRELALEFTAGEADLPKAVARLKEEGLRMDRRLKTLLKAERERSRSPESRKGRHHEVGHPGNGNQRREAYPVRMGGRCRDLPARGDRAAGPRPRTVFRTEQGPVQELPLGGAQDRALRRPLLPWRGRGGAGRGRHGRARLPPPEPRAGSSDQGEDPARPLRLAHRFRADEHHPGADRGGDRRRHRVPEAPRVPSLHGLLCRARSRADARAGARLPGGYPVRGSHEPRWESVLLLPCALVHGGHGGVPLDRRDRQQHEDVAARRLPRGVSDPDPDPRVRGGHPRLSLRAVHLPVHRRFLRDPEDRGDSEAHAPHGKRGQGARVRDGAHRGRALQEMDGGGSQGVPAPDRGLRQGRPDRNAPDRCRAERVEFQRGTLGVPERHADGLHLRPEHVQRRVPGLRARRAHLQEARGGGAYRQLRGAPLLQHLDRLVAG